MYENAGVGSAEEKSSYILDLPKWGLMVIHPDGTEWLATPDC